MWYFVGSEGAVKEASQCLCAMSMVWVFVRPLVLLKDEECSGRVERARRMAYGPERRAGT